LTDYLFYKNAAITLMTLPNVTNIGKSTFEDCSKLTTLNLGNSLAKVGAAAFYNCANITKLTFPETITVIGASAFCNCSSVTEITIGSGLKSVGASSFYGCKSFTALILPDTFTTMGESAFEGCTKLTVAKLGNSLTSVPAKAFKDCISLSEMIVPATATSIGDQAFYNDSGLATITMNEGLKSIGNEVFWNNSGIMQFSIPGTVTTMGTNCFYGCTRTTYLTFRDGDEILTINNSGCRSSKIDALTTQSSYTNRYYDYFYDCPIRFLTLGRNLKYSYNDEANMYDYNGSSFEYKKRASAPFVNSQDLRSVTIGKNVTFLYHHLLNGCSNVAKLIFPDGLKEIYSYAMANCTSLTQLTFPSPLVLLDNNACYNNEKLTSAIFNEEPGNDLSMIIGGSCFASCPGLTTLTFPAKTTSIGNYCFYDTQFLTEITFVDSKNAIKLGYGANPDLSTTPEKQSYQIPLFGNSKLQSLYMGRNIDYEASSSYGWSPFYDQNFLTDVRFSQAGTVTYCKDYLLYNVNNCKSLTLPESLKSIGNSTFRGMTVLQEISIPDAVTEIGAYAFAEDSEMKSVKLSASCPWLKEGLFSECGSLLAITIPPVVTKMDTKLFRNCTSLATATFEGSAELIEMGYGASQAEYGLFRDCPVETLNLNRWLSYNTDAASRSPFYSIATLKNLNIGENVGVIDKYMFSYCTGLEELYLPDNIESVGLWGFRGCSALKTVRFSGKLSQVSDYGFSECIALDNVVFPESMTSIADNSFSNCTSLKTLDLGHKLMIIGPSAFKNDTALEGVELPESLYGLGVEAFSGCSSLPYIAIRGISSVGKQAFQNCTGLQWVSLSDKTTSIGEDSFAGCTGVKYVKSYAEYAPEGLVNFPVAVPENGTLFVPEASIEYYQYSPTWETWLDIRPLNDNIMVSLVALDQTEISFKANETAQLTATVGADDATDKSILWRTSNAEVASVDASGLVSALAVGEADITALAADGSGVNAVCHITVLPTMVESIAITAGNNTLKKGRTLELSLAVLPQTATNTEVTWSTSNPTISTVDENGVVTAIAAGNVTITATATDGSGIVGNYDLTIIPPTKGDSNDNDEVTITDAVNTANYAVGNDVENFCFEAADVNGDKRITLADASGTVTELLNQPAPAVTNMIRRMGRAGQSLDNDNLVVADYSCAIGKTAAVEVTLDNTVDYVALQTDITVPEGMSIVGVEIGDRAVTTHSLMQRRIDDRTMRIALFDLNNSLFSDNDEPMFRIIVKAESQCGDIVLSNALASDASANEYVLTSTGGHNADVSGMGSVVDGSSVRIESTEGGVTIYNAKGEEVRIFTTDGKLMDSFTAEDNVVNRRLVSGIYIVAVANKVAKIMIK